MPENLQQNHPPLPYYEEDEITLMEIILKVQEYYQ